MSDQNRRLAGAIAAYGKSLDVNKTRKRPSSANVPTERSTYALLMQRLFISLRTFASVVPGRLVAVVGGSGVVYSRTLLTYRVNNRPPKKKVEHEATIMRSSN